MSLGTPESCYLTLYDNKAYINLPLTIPLEEISECQGIRVLPSMWVRDPYRLVLLKALPN